MWVRYAAAQVAPSRANTESVAGLAPHIIEPDVLPRLWLDLQGSTSNHELGRALRRVGHRSELRFVWRLAPDHLGNLDDGVLDRLQRVVEFRDPARHGVEMPERVLEAGPHGLCGTS